MKRPRLLLADDHLLLLEAFRSLLQDDFDIAGTVSDGAQLLDAAVRLTPDVIVTDVSMPHMSGIESARRLRDILPSARIVFLTVNEDPQLAAEAFRLGAFGWVLKSSPASELRRAVREALAGHHFLTSAVANGDMASLPPTAKGHTPAEELTPRERQVLSLLAQGKSMKQIAAELGITARTVAFHKYRIMDTLGIRTSAELVQFAVRHGIV